MMAVIIVEHQTLDSSWGSLCVLPAGAFKVLGIAPADWVLIETDEEVLFTGSSLFQIPDDSAPLDYTDKGVQGDISCRPLH